MPFIAVMNTPGYLPWSDDEPPLFEETPDAWEYLADERKRQEDNTDGDSYSATYYTLLGFMHTGHDADVVNGDTPDYDGDHDLGAAYSVVQLETQATRCPCCGDDVIDVPGIACKDCRTAGCERTTDACGEPGYWECQQETEPDPCLVCGTDGDHCCHFDCAACFLTDIPCTDKYRRAGGFVCGRCKTDGDVSVAPVTE